MLSYKNGRWINILLNNTRILHNQKIEEKKGQDESKCSNFYMNDGDNVVVSNALGVILLEIGSQWEAMLEKDSPMKERALDLLL